MLKRMEGSGALLLQSKQSRPGVICLVLVVLLLLPHAAQAGLMLKELPAGNTSNAGEAPAWFAHVSAGFKTIAFSAISSSDSAPRSGSTITAASEPPPVSYTVTVTSTVGGSTDKDGINTVPEGTGIVIRPTADTGYTFTGWSGDASGKDEPLVIVPTANMSIQANFQVSQYTIQVSSFGPGSTDQDGTHTVTHGDSFTVQAIPDTGAFLDFWVVNSGSQSPSASLSFTVTEDLEIAAAFELNTYTLSFQHDGNGSLSGSTSQTVTHGEDASTVTAQPNGNYIFVNWTDSSNAVVSTNAALTVTNVSSSETYTANYELNEHTVTVTSTTGGSTNKDGVNTVLDGTGIVIWPTADTGYTFTGWSGDASGKDEPLAIVPTGDMSIQANFEVSTYTVKVIVHGRGTTDQTGTHTLTHGDSFTVQATPDTGAVLDFWVVNSRSQSPTSSLTFTVTEDLEIDAVFKSNSYQLHFNHDGNGLLSGLTSQTVEHGSDASTVTAQPNGSYLFVNWTDSNDIVVSTNPALTVTDVSGPETYTAHYQFTTHTVTVSNSVGGSTDKDGANVVNHGDSLTVEATANTGYTFKNWTGDITSTDNPLTVTPGADMAIQANYQLNQYTVEVSVSGTGSGSTDKTGSNTVSHGDTFTVEATADASSEFSHWDGDIAQTSNNPLSVTVTDNMAITAWFTLREYQLTFQTDGNGSLAGTTSQTVNHGSDAGTVTAQNSASHTFQSWTDSGNTVVSTDPALTVTGVIASETYTANYMLNSYQVTFQTDGNGALSGSTPQTVNHGENATTVTAQDSASHSFLNWTDSSSNVVSSNPALTVSNVTAPETYTANYTLNQYTVTVATATGGSTDRDGANTVDHGSSITITPSPTTGYHFTGWSGDAGGADNPLTVTVTSDLSINAAFGINTYAITTDVLEGSGTISASADSANHGDSVVFTITPESGWSVQSFTVNGESRISDLVTSGGMATYTLASIEAAATAVVSFSRDLGNLHVKLEPAADAGWRLEGGDELHESGTTEYGIKTGFVALEFVVPAGYKPPARILVEILKDQTTVITVMFSRVEEESGEITVDISVTADGITPRWRIVEAPPGTSIVPGNLSDWYESGTRLMNAMPGRYTIEFSAEPGYLKPGLQTFILEPGGSFEISVQYLRPFIAGGNDVNGDSLPDYVVRSENGKRVLALSNDGEEMLMDAAVGKPGDVIVPGDYDGDGDTDYGFYRPRNGMFRVPGLFRLKRFGGEGAIPVPGDYDGDGITDAALYDPAAGTWMIHFRKTGETVVLDIGSTVEVPVPADWDGDNTGMTDPATWNVNTGKWTVWTWREKRQRWKKYGPASLRFGTAGDIPAAADYDGDGAADHVVYRPSSGTWIARDPGDLKRTELGYPGDLPIPADWLGRGYAVPAVFNPATGIWRVPGGTLEVFFGAGGMPLITGAHAP